MSKKKFGWVLVCLFSLATSLPAQISLLHSFAGGTGDGEEPWLGSLILSGSTLYGMTRLGGTIDDGAIFKINTDGTGFALLHSFAGAPSDGSYPYESLIISGSTLYGMTYQGGTNDGGTIFEINTDGTGFTLLHSFVGGLFDGLCPLGSLILSGSTLYGMTYQGGTSNIGTTFKIATNGTGFALLHSFAAGASDGAGPISSLILSGSTLYGMTHVGGTGGKGTIFKINTDGSGFTLLHSFASGATDGSYPYGSLIISGSTLHGMTPNGGTIDGGTIFEINTDGSGFTLLHSFAPVATDGAEPYGSLIISGSKLYGMTSYGSTGGYGTICKINTDGTGFALLHSFGSGATDGAEPGGSLILSGSMLYGMTTYGGASGLGVIFSFNLAGYADIAVTKSSDNLAPLMGSDFNFTITAKNNGPDAATGLQVTDPLPSGLSYVSSTPSQGTYSSATGVWDIGSLAKDATATLTLKVSAASLGAIMNTASVSALNESDPVNSNDSASVTVNVTSQYSLTTTASPAAGGTVTPAGKNWYDKDSVVQVQATANSGYVFTGWSGDLSGTTNPATVTMTGTKNVAANFVSGKTLNSPTLLAPLNNVIGQPTTVALKWQDTNSSPQELKYKVRIKKAGGAYANYTLAANAVQYIKSGLTLSKAYFWNVMALGNGTTTKNSAWANGGVDFKFTVQPPVTLNVPTLVSPANGAAGQPTTMTLQWLDTNSSPQELKYKIRLKPAGGGYAYFTTAANAVSYLKSGLVRNKVYYWSVQAKGNGTSTKDSAFPADWKFTTAK